MDIPRLKRLLRREVRDRIRAMEPADRRRQQASLDLQFPSLPGLEPSTTVLLYLSAFAEEFETRGMIERARDLGKVVLLPRVDESSGTLRLHRVRSVDEGLIPGPRGVLEPRNDSPEVGPDEVDWVLVPGLAFDDRGCRLGRGRGHYDRLLDRLRPEVPRWALGFDAQLVDSVPIEPHDRPVSGVATPSRPVREPSEDGPEFPAPTR